jgi:hypothetical protein
MAKRRRRSDRSGRAPLFSPGRPAVAGRDEQRRFWAAIAVDTVVAVKCLFLIRLELLGPTLLGMKACWSPWDGRQARAARARPILGCGA